jgi:hypothetical protein
MLVLSAHKSRMQAAIDHQVVLPCLFVPQHVFRAFADSITAHPRTTLRDQAPAQEPVPPFGDPLAELQLRLAQVTFFLTFRYLSLNSSLS